MKTIGILGGMGSYATVEIFRRIVDAFPAEKEWERPRIIIDNNCVMPSRVRAILYKEKMIELIEMMKSSIRMLDSAGADIIFLGCITAHSFFDKLPCKNKLVSILNLVNEEIKEKEVFVLCTEGTMESRIWDKAVTKVNFRYPSEDQMLKLRDYIEKVKTGNMNSNSKNEFAEYVNGLEADNILLGCTELPILTEKKLIKKNLYDPIEVLVNYLKLNCCI